MAIGPALERLAARASLLAPAPPSLRELGALRGRVAEELLARHRRAIAGASSDDDRARLAEELVAAHRLETAARAGELGSGWLRFAARLDGRLPTDAPEYMDLPSRSEPARAATQRAMHRFNRGFGSYVRFAEALAPLLAGLRAPTVLDLASGHAGFPIALANTFRDARVIASDLRPEYVAEAHRRVAEARVSVEVRVLDALRIDEGLDPAEPIDAITCTQSLHHFGAGGVARLLAVALPRARRGVLLIDLTRSLSHLALLGAVALGSLAGADFAHDATLSVRKAFVPEELALIARCVPGGDALEALYLPPGFTALRTRS